MFTGSNASIIRRMQRADEVAIEIATRLNRESHDEMIDKRSTLLLPVRKPARSVPSMPLLRSRVCA